jgi:RNA polymerase sigma factor (sigma-70 family)
MGEDLLGAGFMPSPSLETAVRHIRSLAAPPPDGLADRDLVARFRATKDEPAFAALVARHGPAVLGVCRRVLDDRHSAEDAFQATFLVLARRAASIQKSASVGCWLHGVAYRVATKLKGQLARRPRPGALPDVAAEPRDDVSWKDVRRVLDEEVNRLPDRLRLPILLCYFEGKTRDEAAEALGWKLSTLRGRLEDGRVRLRDRLALRGVELSVALLAVSTADAFAIDDALIESAVRASRGSAPAPVKALAQGVAMTGKLKLVACALVIAVGMGTTLMVYRGEAGEGPKSGPGPKDPPSPAPPAKVEPKATEWGELSDGLRARLRPPKEKITAGERVAFEFDLKNEGSKAWDLPADPADIRIELDGKWHTFFARVDDEPLRAPSRELKPGGELAPFVTVKPDTRWLTLIPKPGMPGEHEAGYFTLTPGKHKVATQLVINRTTRVTTPPIEIEVAPSGWGEPTSGMQARARLAKPTFKAGEPLTFELDLRNRGGTTFEDGPIPFHCEVELDGHWFKYNLPLSYPTSIQKLKPGGEWVPYVKVSMDEWWQRTELSAKGEPVAFALTPGKHKLRVAYPVSVKDGVKPVSAPVEFEVKADAKDADLATLVAAADRIVIADLFEKDGRLRFKPSRTLKGPSSRVPAIGAQLMMPEGTEGLPPDWRTKSGDLESILFLKAEEDGHALAQYSPAVSKGWFRPSSVKEVNRVLEAMPKPKEKGKADQGLSLSLQVATAEPQAGEALRFDVVLANEGTRALRVLQHRYGMYDYWPFLTFTVTLPNGEKVTLAKPEGAIKKEDFIDECQDGFGLKQGESYVHTVRLDKWPAGPRKRTEDLGLPDFAFQQPGTYKVEATYKVPPGFKNVRPGNWDEWPFWGGELTSNTVTVEVKPPPVAVERLKDFRAHADSLHLALSMKVPGKEPLPADAQLLYVYLDARPIPREPHATWADGRPIGADARIALREAEKLIDALAADGFFERAYDGEKAREAATNEFLLELWHDRSGKSRLRLEYMWTETDLRRLQKLPPCLFDTQPDLISKLLAPVADTVPPWGQAEAGLQARLRTDRDKWPAGKVPTLELEIRNRGTETWSYCAHPAFVEIELNGAWFTQADIPAERLSQVFKPGSRTDRPLRLTLTSEWTRPGAGGVGGREQFGPGGPGLGNPPFGGQGFRPPPVSLEFNPGKHTVRAAYRFEKAGGNPPVRVVSNPVEIEIADYPNGKPVRGVTARLRLSQEKWPAGESPRFDFEIRNDGKGIWNHGAGDRNCLIEVDGVWYENENGRNPADGPQWVLPAGAANWAKKFDVYADRPRGGGRSWVLLTPDDQKRPIAEDRQLKLTPGKHTIRVAYFLTEQRADGKAGDEIRVETNAVEFEIAK